jgi:hypothetical protein
MTVGTEELLLHRALERARPEDYLAWAVEQLGQDVDTPSLRILAGLSPRFDREEVERYFLLTAHELGLSVIEANAPPLEIARRIRQSHDRGAIDAGETVEMMAEVHRTWEYREDLLAPWRDMHEELSGCDGFCYPTAKLVALDDAVRLEWSLFDRALALRLPDGWIRLAYCADCGHVGRGDVEWPGVVARFIGAMRGRPVGGRTLCGRCASGNIRALTDPDVRSAYFAQMERQQK